MKRAVVTRSAAGAAMVVGLLVLAACKKGDNTSTAGSAATSASAAPSGAASLTALTAPTDSAVGEIAPTADPDKLPPPAAHETQATKDIQTNNYKSELDAVEKELNSIK